MNKLQWIGVIGIVIVLVIMITGCTSYDIEWARGAGLEPVLITKTS